MLALSLFLPLLLAFLFELLRQPLQQRLGLIAGHQLRQPRAAPIEQRCMQPPGCRDQLSLAQMLLVRPGQGGRRTGVGADHLNHHAILRGTPRCAFSKAGLTSARMQGLRLTRWLFD